jgi:excisionase family DNA binding protein
MVELNGETYLNGNEACHLLGVKVSTLYTYVSRGVLKSYRQGIKRQRLYKRSELEALLQLRPSGAPIASSAFSPVSSSEQADDAPSPKKDHAEIPLAEDWVPYT